MQTDCRIQRQLCLASLDVVKMWLLMWLPDFLQAKSTVTSNHKQEIPLLSVCLSACLNTSRAVWSTSHEWKDYFKEGQSKLWKAVKSCRGEKTWLHYYTILDVREYLSIYRPDCLSAVMLNVDTRTGNIAALLKQDCCSRGAVLTLITLKREWHHWVVLQYLILKTRIVWYYWPSIYRLIKASQINIENISIM